jgi:F-type H+-transporting ATPase subunit a
MADPILHIKDAYFFELPKLLAPSTFISRSQFPEVWARNDDEFQNWEFDRLYSDLIALQVRMPSKEESREAWHHWQHENHDNFAAPFDEFLDSRWRLRVTEFHAWRKAETAKLRAESHETAANIMSERTIEDYLSTVVEPFESFVAHRESPQFQAQWRAARHKAGGDAAVREWQKDASLPEWSKEKLDGYNFHLSGKVIIPQPFGELRNLHETQSSLINPTDRWGTDGIINRDDFGFAISKFMVIEVGVALILWVVFSWLASKVASGKSPRGWAWNLLEPFVIFIRDQIARPALDGHHDEDHGEHGHDAHSDAQAPAVAAKGHAGHDDHGHKPAAHGHASHAHDKLPSQTYLPYLCTIFFFILGMNLAGMLPWIGAPTGTWAVTLALAITVLLAGFVGGVKAFGVGGYFLNQIPSMDLPPVLAVILKPMIFLIELLGLIIKHAVLSVRLLANMLAGHMVLLAIMALAFGATAASQFVNADGSVSPIWWVAAVCSVVGCALLSLLELFVAFLQAYVFTLLSALFIGAAIHKH